MMDDRLVTFVSLLEDLEIIERHAETIGLGVHSYYLS
jgi:hypothetical protein